MKIFFIPFIFWNIWNRPSMFSLSPMDMNRSSLEQKCISKQASNGPEIMDFRLWNDVHFSKNPLMFNPKMDSPIWKFFYP